MSLLPSDSVTEQLLEHGYPGPEADPAEGLPPGGGRHILPHIVSFASQVNALSRTYRWTFDEALRHSETNARAIRRDPMILEALRTRQMPTAQLAWHLEPQNPQDSAQIEASKLLTEVVESIPRFQQFKMHLLEALWFGRYGVMTLPRWDWSTGQKRLVISDFRPVNGDKLVFKWSGQPGILVHSTYDGSWQLTDRGRVHFFSPEEREQLVIHEHEPEDADFFEGELAGSIHGVGIRGRVYWLWYLRTQVMTWMMDYLERVGAGGFTIYFYEAGSDQSFNEVLNAAQTQVTNNVILFPRYKDNSTGGPGIQRIEPSNAGAQLLGQLITSYFDLTIRRYILGQNISSEAKGMTVGSGPAELDAGTFGRIVKYDAINLAETLTKDLITVLAKYNTPGVPPPRFVFDVDKPNAEELLKSAKVFWDMGGSLDENELRSILGLAEPGPGHNVLAKLGPVQPAGVGALPAGVPMVGEPGPQPQGQTPPIPPSGGPEPAGRDVPTLFRRSGRLVRYALQLRPDPRIADLARRYVQEAGLNTDPVSLPYHPVNPEVSRRVAQVYDSLPHAPNDPDVTRAYDAMKRETLAQFNFLRQNGVKFEPWTWGGQPYGNSEEMRQDVLHNNHLYFFTGGDFPEDHHLREPAGVNLGGVDLTHNDVFRAVHDFFGHALHGNQFGPRGEEHAYRVHSQFYSPEARPAVAMETRGQNSWVNFGPHSHLPATERPYAEQKNNILPDELLGDIHAPSDGDEVKGFDRSGRPIRYAYDPDEPRDEHGRWTATGWAKKALLGVSEVPGRLLNQARRVVSRRYEQLSERYGPKMAVAILGAGLVGTAVPLPGTSFLAAAPLLAAAELYLRMKKRDDAEPVRMAMTPNATAEVSRLGKKFIAGLLTACRKHIGQQKKELPEPVQYDRQESKSPTWEEVNALDWDKPTDIGGETYINSSYFGPSILRSVPVASLVSGPGQRFRNPAIVEDYRKMIREHGDLPSAWPLYVSEHAGGHRVWDGHHKWDAAKAEGLTHVPAYVDLPRPKEPVRNAASSKVDLHQKSTSRYNIPKLRYGKDPFSAAETRITSADDTATQQPQDDLGVQWHAPAGGVDLHGQFYQGGEPLPHDVIRSLPPSHQQALSKLAIRDPQEALRVYVEKPVFSKKEQEKLGKQPPAFGHSPRAGESFGRSRSKVPSALEPYLREDELRELTKHQVGELVKLWNQLPNDLEFVEAARLGKVKRGWYANAAAKIGDLFGHEAPRFAALLAATSPRVPVKKNLTKTLRVWKLWRDADSPSDPEAIQEHLRRWRDARYLDGFASHDNNIVNALSHKDPGTEQLGVLSGYKVDSFRRNLLGNLDPVTNDVWIANFAGIPHKAVADAGGYFALSAKVRRAVSKLNANLSEGEKEWTPAEVQEAIWSFFRTLARKQAEGRGRVAPKDKRPQAPQNPLRALQAITGKDIKDTVDFSDLIEGDADVQEALRELGLRPRTRKPRSRGVGGGVSPPAADLEHPVATGATAGDQDLLERIARRAGRHIGAFLGGRIKHRRAGRVVRYDRDDPVQSPQAGPVPSQTATAAEAPDTAQEDFAFFSPNVEENLSFEQALSRHRSSNQAAFRKLTDHILKTVGVRDFQSHDAIGDWSDGAENSVVQVIRGRHDPEDVKYAAAWYGLMGNQKSVLTFHADDQGPDSVYQIRVPETDTQKVRQQLDDLGIKYRTLIPSSRGHLVVVVDFGRSLRPAVARFAEMHNATVREAPGQAHELGGGTTRSASRAAYRDIIRAYESGTSPNRPVRPRYRPPVRPGPTRYARPVANPRKSRRSAEASRLPIKAPSGGAVVHGIYYPGGGFVPQEARPAAVPQYPVPYRTPPSGEGYDDDGPDERHHVPPPRTKSINHR